jgi:hypothetical protein
MDLVEKVERLLRQQQKETKFVQYYVRIVSFHFHVTDLGADSEHSK